MLVAHLALIECSNAATSTGWHTRQDPKTKRFGFFRGDTGPIQVKGVSMSGLETGTRHDGTKGGGGGYWVFGSGKQVTTILDNVVKTLASPGSCSGGTCLGGWNATAVRVPMCSSAWLQDFPIYDWDDTTLVIRYRDWVDAAIQSIRANNMIAILDNHLWAIGPESVMHRAMGPSRPMVLRRLCHRSDRHRLRERLQNHEPLLIMTSDEAAALPTHRQRLRASKVPCVANRTLTPHQVLTPHRALTPRTSGVAKDQSAEVQAAPVRVVSTQR